MDPPYLKSTRSKNHAYLHDWKESDHSAMLNKIDKTNSNIIVSGYRSKMYDDFFDRFIEIKSATQGKTATEVLYFKEAK